MIDENEQGSVQNIVLGYVLEFEGLRKSLFGLARKQFSSSLLDNVSCANPYTVFTILGNFQTKLLKKM
uniref:Uncharacterized protein n=1 Tax=Romanomermis culicivorax TaxID=13658 RepID=A0A915JMW8_ROMCU